MEEDIPVHLRSVAYYALILTCGDKDSYRRFLKAFRYSTVKSGRVAHWSAAAWIDPPPWPRPPGSGRCFSADPEPTAPAPLSGAPGPGIKGGATPVGSLKSLSASAALGVWPWSRPSKWAKTVLNYWSATGCSKSMKRVTGRRWVRRVSRPLRRGPRAAALSPWDGNRPWSRRATARTWKPARAGAAIAATLCGAGGGLDPYHLRCHCRPPRQSAAAPLPRHSRRRPPNPARLGHQCTGVRPRCCWPATGKPGAMMSNTEVHSVNAKSMLAGFSIAVVAPQNSEASDPCPRCGARVPRVLVCGL